MEAGSGKRDAGNGTREAGNARRAPIRSYEDLEVYQRSMQLLVPLHALVRKFPSYEQYELGSQLRRASKSIPANIAEGYGKKRSAKEFRAYLGHGLGSANEVIVHLKIANALGYTDASDVDDLVDGYTIVAKQLHTLVGAWQSFDTSPSANPASRIRPQSRIPHLASNNHQGVCNDRNNLHERAFVNADVGVGDRRTSG